MHHFRTRTSYSSIESMLENSQDLYRRDIWNDQDVYVEIWLEKEALAGVLYEITQEYDVPLMVCHGYPSLSFLYSAAEAIKYQFKPTHLYYFGDHDPSGKDIPRFVEKEIRSLAPDTNMNFELVAVTEEQIVEIDLPTRPTKKTDSRSKSFKGKSTEVDAIHPTILKQMCRNCIEKHIDKEQLERTLRVEEVERASFEEFISKF